MDIPTPGQFGLVSADVHTIRFSAFEPPAVLVGLGGWSSFFLVLWKTEFSFLNRDATNWPLLLLAFVPGMLMVLLVAYVYHTYQVERARRRVDRVALAAYDAAYAAYSALETERRRAEQAAREGERRRIREQEAWWASLDGNAFERELTALFRTRGLDVRRTGGSGDGGIDLEVRRGAKRIIVQCKAHKSWLSPGTVRDLYGTLIHVSADEAWLVTTSGFYSGARAFAAGKPIRLYTIQQFLTDPSFPPDA